MISAVVFDIGGVLIGLDMGRCIGAFRERLGYDRITEILDPYHQKGIYGEMEAGQLTEDEFRSSVLSECRPGCRPRDVDACMRELLSGMEPDAVQTVKDLATRYPLYILSNNNPISMRHIYAMFRENGLDPALFKGEFLSYRLRIMKPSPEIYQTAARSIGLPAGELLFIDDNPANVQAARDAGWQARLYVPGTRLSTLLADL